MKNRTVRILLFTILGLLAFVLGASAASIDFSAIDLSGLGSAGAMITAAAPLMWIKNNAFKELSPEEFDGLDEHEQGLYLTALKEHREARDIEIAKQIKELQKDAETNKDTIEGLIKELNGINSAQIKEMLTALEIQGKELTALRRKGEVSGNTFEKSMKKAFDETLSKAKASLAKGAKVTTEVSKATQTYGDITTGEELATIRPGVIDKPVRMPKIRSLFRTIPLSTEFYKYIEQSLVTRDAQNVAKCSAVTSTTKEELTLVTVETKKVKDIISFCLDFVADYPFMQSRIRLLIDQSLALKIDEQLLLGTGTGLELTSIDSVSSEFSAVNPACDVSAAIQGANYVDLLLAMETQIVELGQQEAFTPDTILVNKCDWFLNVESLKDANNNYLDTRVTLVNGVPYLNGMQVIWTPIVLQNSCYVIDTTKGDIIDRQVLSLEIATQNGTDWEQEIASLKGFERLNLVVPSNWANAFMKCSDVATAITAITKP